MQKNKAELLASIKLLLDQLKTNPRNSLSTIGTRKSILHDFRKAIQNKLIKSHETVSILRRISGVLNTFLISIDSISENPSEVLVDIGKTLELLLSSSRDVEKLLKEQKEMYYEMFFASFHQINQEIALKVVKFSDRSPTGNKFDNLTGVMMRVYSECVRRDVLQFTNEECLSNIICNTAFVRIKNNKSLADAVYTASAHIACDEYIILLGIIECFIKKLGTFKGFIETNREKIKEIFILAGKFLVIHSEKVFDGDILKEHPLSVMFKRLLKIIFLCKDRNEGVEFSYDIQILFQLFISQIPKDISNEKGFIVRWNILYFFEKFILEAKNMPRIPLDIGIQDILFEAFIFCSEEDELQEKWALIWDNLVSKSESQRRLVESICQHISQKINDQFYLSKVQNWILNQSVLGCEFIKVAAKYNMQYEIFQIHLKNLDNSSSTYLLTIISLLSKIPEPKNNDNALTFLSIMLEKMQEQYIDEYQQILASIIQAHTEKALPIFLNSFKKQGNQKILSGLINTVLILLRDEKDNNFIQKELLTGGLTLHIVKNLPFNINKKVSPVNSWKQTFECLNSLARNIKDPELISSFCFDFAYAVKLFRSANYKPFQLEIIANTIDLLCDIVFNKQSNSIVHLSGITLLIEFLSYRGLESGYYKLGEFLLEDPTNFSYVVRAGLVSIILYHLNTSNSTFWANFDTRVTNALRLGISFYEFSHLIKTISKSQENIKTLLLTSLKNALRSSYNKDCAANSVVFNSNSCVYLSFEKSAVPITRQFTICFWVYLSSSICEILYLECTEDNIEICFQNEQIHLCINDSNVITSAKLQAGSWVFISLSIQLEKVARVLNRKKAVFYIHHQNNRLTEKYENKVKLSEKNDVLKVRIGSNYIKNETFKQGANFSFSKSDNTLAKLKYLHMFSKCLQESEVHALINMTWQYSFYNIPESPLTTPKLISELQENLIYLWNSTFFYEKNMKTINTLQYYPNPGILDLISLYGPKKLFFKLCDECSDVSQLSLIYEIFHKLLVCDKSWHVLDESTVLLVTHYLNTKSIDNRINDIYIKLIEDSNPVYGKILFENYLSNQKCMFLSSKSKLYEGILQKFLKFKSENSLSNLVSYCELLKGLKPTMCNDYLSIYFNSPLQKNDLSISLILKKLLKEDELTVIRCFCELFLMKFTEFAETSKIPFVLLHILEKVTNIQLQIDIIGLLCIKPRPESQFVNLESSEHYADMINSILPESLSENLMNYLLEEGVKEDKYLETTRKIFVDIVMNRVKNLTSENAVNNAISVFSKDRDKIFDLIYNRNVFPHWLIFCMKKSQFGNLFKEFAMIIFSSIVSSTNYSLNKMIEFFFEVPILDLYMYTVQMTVFPDLETTYQFFMVFVNIQDDVIIGISDQINHYMDTFLQNKSFMKFVEESLNVDMLLNNIKGPSRQDLDKIKQSYFLMGEYLKFSIRLLKLLPHNQAILETLKSFLGHSNVKYFNKYSDSPNKSKQVCELYIVCYFFYYLTKLYYKFPEDYLNFLQDFAVTSKVFKKISIILQMNSDEVFFQSLAMEKTAAIITANSEYSDSNMLDNTKSIDSISKSFGPDFDTLMKNAKICQDVLENTPSAIADILSKKNDPWMIVYEKVSQLIKNYKRMYIPYKFVRYSEFMTNSYCLLDDDIKRFLTDSEDMTWLEIYQRSVLRHQAKLKQECEKFRKILAWAENPLELGQMENARIRQCYDKFYRWVFLKPDKKKVLKKYQKISYAVEPSSPKCCVSQTVTRHLSEVSVSDRRSEPSLYHSSTAETLKICVLEHFTCPAELIKIQGTVFGSIVIFDKMIEFFSYGDIKPIGQEYIGSALNCAMVIKDLSIIWTFSEISEIIFRRFIHRHTAIEILLHTGKSYLINLFKEDFRTEFIKKLHPYKNIKITCKTPTIEIESYTNDWKKHAISNFEYLMIINKYASRSMHDLSQYPVFPWIYADYKSENCKNDPSMFRDLNFPIGAQSEESREIVLRKKDMWREEDIELFMWGSFYSTGGHVLHYLLRLEPYSQEASALQGGNYDVADRLFISIELSWESTQWHGHDNKEIVPELFYQPWCLMSYGNKSYGITQDNVKIVSVEYPKWAVSNWDFIKKHRMLLESHIVSRDLGLWIDLIFGYKQSGEKAEEAFNLYCGPTYEHVFNKKKDEVPFSELESLYDQVYHFGQTPVCLFTKRLHPKRDEKIYDNFEDFFNKNNSEDSDIKGSEKDEKRPGTAHAIFVTSKQVFIIKSVQDRFYVVKYTQRELGDFIVPPSEYRLKFLVKYESLDQLCENFKNYGFNVKLGYTDVSFCLFKETMIVSALHKTNSVFVHDLKGNLINFFSFHKSIVTSVCCSSELVFSGSADSTLVSWKVKEKDHTNLNKIYYGHSSPILIVKCLESFSVIISANYSEILLIHDIRSTECLRKISYNFFTFDVSNQGIIGLISSAKNSVTFLGLNGEEIYTKQTEKEIGGIKFNLAGTVCFEIYNDKVMISDPTDHRKKIRVVIDGVSIIAIHPEEKFSVACKNSQGNKEETLMMTIKNNKKVLHKFIKELI